MPTKVVILEADEHLAHLKETNLIAEVKKETHEKIIMGIQRNYQSIEQDMMWKINKSLGIEQ